MAFTVDIKGNASHLDKTLKGVNASLNAIGSMATTGLKSLAGIGLAGGAAMTAFIVSSSKAAADVEDLAIQFEVLTGSEKKAAELMKVFRDEEKKSALNLSDYANAAKTMLAFGTSLDDVTPSLRMLGDVSMGNSERFGSLALAFAQTTAAGRLMGQEVLQFVNAGFNPLEQISRDTGRSMAQLKKEMEDGAISVEMVKKAFVNATSEGGRFYKAIDKGSGGTNAKLNQLGAAVTQLQVAFGTGFNEGLKDALDAANNYLPQLEKKFKESGQIVGNSISLAVEGNAQQLGLVGEYIGEVILAGIEAAVVIGFNKIMNIGNNVLKATGGELATGASLLTGGDGGNYAAQFTKGKPIAPTITRAISQVSQSETLKELRKNNARLQDSIDMKDFGKTTKESTKEGVKEGMKEIWYSLETGAKFSN